MDQNAGNYLQSQLANAGQLFSQVYPEAPITDRERAAMAERLVSDLRHGDPGDPLLLKARRVLQAYLGDV